jgi:hypothetical protein
LRTNIGGCGGREGNGGSWSKKVLEEALAEVMKVLVAEVGEDGGSWSEKKVLVIQSCCVGLSEPMVCPTG